jgi:hypothetical protein
MAKQRIDKSFVSELDQFIQQYDLDHPEKSDSQIADFKKHQRISQLRDNERAESAASSKIWEDFLNEGPYTG